jgi:tryptophanyl-tRNA synthetase
MRILSGVQPSGALHLGNYFGMMQRAVALQDQGESFYFIADYHALTTVSKPEVLRHHTLEVARAFLACGVDPQRTVFFRQSAIPEVHELAWLLSIVTPMGLLERAHSYKDKLAKGLSATHGLFAYPVLMAADILLYQADRVPVGKDQKQHLEIARDLAQKFNEHYGPVFRVPEPDILGEVAVVPGIDGEKMSKSYDNTLELFGDPKIFAKKVMSLKTDSSAVDQPKPIEGSLLVALHKLVTTPAEHDQWLASMRQGGRGYGDYKKELLHVLETYLAPMRARHEELLPQTGYIEEVLYEGARRAREVAQATMQQARHAVGLS